MASLFTDDEKELIRKAIADAEEMTSGEIRVFFEKSCSIDVYDRALKVFYDLKMNETKDRNGVLFYLAYSDHKFAIIGDEGIHNKVKQDFWDEVKTTCVSYFSRNMITEGIVSGVEMAGEKLKSYFPYNKNDKNELSNDIIINE